MKTFSITLLVLFLSASLQSFAQDDHDWEAKVYELGDFQKVDLEGGFNVYLVQGANSKLEIRATDWGVFEDIDVSNNQSTLKLEVERKPFDFERVNLYITFNKLEEIYIEGGVKLKTRGYLDLEDFKIRVEGGAKIDLDIKARDVDVIAEGGVIFELRGVAENVNVSVSGAGHVDAEDLKSKNVSFKVEGVGTGSVYATDNLYAKIEGVGKIKYRGNPKVTKNIEGVGSVKRD